MAITADDVSLEDIIPISLDFAVVEGELLPYVILYLNEKLVCQKRYCIHQNNFLVK